MNRDFDQLVDSEGLAPDEEKRLRRVHEMLVSAGPPAELTPLSLQPAQPGRSAGRRSRRGQLIRFPAFRRRPRAAALVLAATIAAACFGGGYVIANQAHGGTINAVRVVSMQGAQNSLASLRVGAADQNGNLPMELTVNGLPRLKNPRAYYILMLVDEKGKPGAMCGTFRVENGTTSVRFSVPYKITPSTRWVVTAVSPGVHWPGHVVMTTSTNARPDRRADESPTGGLHSHEHGPGPGSC